MSSKKHSKLVALYRKPDDIAAFEKAYFETHTPLVHKMPGLLDLRVTKFQRNVMGGEAPYYMMAELLFDNEAALKAAMDSPEGKAAAANLMSFAGRITTLLIAEDVSAPSLV